MFEIGQLVVCVDDQPHEDSYDEGPFPIVRGSIYTIRDFEVVADEWGTDLCLFLEEVTGGYADDGEEIPWKAERFRPCRKTSLDVFDVVRKPVEVA